MVEPGDPEAATDEEPPPEVQLEALELPSRERTVTERPPWPDRGPPLVVTCPFPAVTDIGGKPGTEVEP